MLYRGGLTTTDSRFVSHRSTAAFAALAVVAGLLSAVGFPASIAQGSPSSPGGGGDQSQLEAPDAQSALASAKRSKHRVEIASLRSETSQTFANPSGTLTFSESIEPERVRQGSRWVPVDTRLVFRPDGSVGPLAASADVAFSAGGTTSLARIRSGDRELALSWRGTLPRPKLRGSAATYPEVMPGVDLQVEASALGFSEVLLVKTREAAANRALARVRFGLSTKGVTAKASSDGRVDVRDAANTLVFTAPTPLMWDGRAAITTSVAPGARQLGPGRTDAAASVPASKAIKVDVSGGELSVVPDPVMLADPNAVLPISIDPSFSAYKANNAWTTVWSKYPDSRFWQNDHTSSDTTTYGAAKVGRTRDCTGCGDYTIRTFFAMNTAPISGKHILDAKFQISQKWSWVCDSNVNASSRKAGVWATGAISPSTTWNNQPGWGDPIATADAAHAVGSDNGCAPAGQVEFSVTSAVQTAASSWWATLTLGMRGLNEGDVNFWKRYDANPTIAITYNSYPNAPTALTAGGKACAIGATRPYVTTKTPALTATISDPDADQQALNASFYWWAQGGARNETDKVTRTPVANPAPASVSIPAGRLADGQTYSYQAVTGDGHDVSQASQMCEFTVDATPPAAPRSVSSTDYPADGSFHGEVGRAGTFVVTPPASGLDDVDSYVFSLGLNPRAEDGVAVPAVGAAKTAQVALTPNVDGNLVLRVWSRDKAGNLSDPAHPAEYRFLVHVGSAPAAHWTFDDLNLTPAPDATGHGNPVALNGQLQWGGVGRQWTDEYVDQSLYFDGTATYAATAGPLSSHDPVTDAPTVVRTDGNFSVAAWVELPSSAGSGESAVISQDGTRTSAYYLGYNATTDRWVFGVAGSDVDNATVAKAVSNAAPRRGIWVHLMGVYDAGMHKATLYVDGTAQTATGTVTGGFNSTGRVQLGRRLSNGAPTGYFTGNVSDVVVYGRAVSTSEIPSLVRPLQPRIGISANSAVVGFQSNFYVSVCCDTNVTAVKYSIGDTSLDRTATLTDGYATFPYTPTEDGDLLIAAAAVDPAGRRGAINIVYLTVAPHPSVAGRVTDLTSGTPIAGATVRAVSEGGGPEYTTTTAADGTYDLTGMYPGRATVWASSGSACGGLFGITDVTVNGATLVDLALAPQADAFGYVCGNAAVPFAPADTAVLPLTGDDAVVPIDLPFAFTYYGHTFSTAWVDTNGLMSFVDPDGSHLGDDSAGTFAGAPNGYLAPFWTDLVVDSAASVRTTTVEAGANSQFVVEWRNAYLFGDPTKRVTFEVVLSADGTVRFNYSGLDGGVELGTGAKVAIESPRGFNGITYSFHQPALANGSAITFRYPTNPHPVEDFAVSGTVTVAGTGTPVAGARVTLDYFSPPIETTTAADGTYAFADLYNSDYTISAADDKACGLRGTTEVTASGDTIADIVLRPEADAAGYTCAVGSTPFVRVESSTTTPVQMDDGLVARLPFTLPIYGQQAHDVWIFDWGYLETTPSADGLMSWIVPLYGDWTSDASSSLRVGMVGSAPNRKLVVEYRNMLVNDPAPFRMSWEAVLAEDGTITFNYADLPANGKQSSAFSEIRLESVAGGVFDYLEDGKTLHNNEAVTFRPPSG